MYILQGNLLRNTQAAFSGDDKLINTQKSFRKRNKMHRLKAKAILSLKCLSCTLLVLGFHIDWNQGLRTLSSHAKLNLQLYF
jgi:hypothetical protein